MSETARTDDSAPSLSSYPPAFVTLISTFIKRAEEAEIRAHKALVILRTKDEQVLRLQKRLEALEKIAAQLEGVMVPPLDLPQSPSSNEDLDGAHPRDTNELETKQEARHPPLETLYERYPTAHLRMKHGNSEGQEVHNCYTRCQHLIDGLERSNSQLREALVAESQQRVRDHEQYVDTLAGVTQAVKDWQLRNKQVHCDPQQVTLQGDSIPKAVVEDITSVLKASGDSLVQNEFKEDVKQNSLVNKNEMALLVNEEIQKKVDTANHIIKSLQKRLEKEDVKKEPRRVRSKKSKKGVKSSSDSLSYHTALSCVSISPKIKYCPSQFSLNSLKRKNIQLRIKYHYIHKKYKEGLSWCEKLQENLASKRNENDIKKYEAFTQTDRLRKENVCELLSSETRTRLIEGRLAAAGKVMANQQKKLKDMQQQLINSQAVADSLRKRLAHAEGSLAGQVVNSETAMRQMQDAQDRNNALSKEMQQLKESVCQLTQKLATQVEINSKIENQKNEYEKKLEDMMKTMEMQLNTLELTLQKRDEMSELAKEELQTKLIGLREQFVAQLSEARSRLEAADCKIQQLYFGIETFLKLLFGLRRTTSTPTTILSPDSQSQALQLAGNILQLKPSQMQAILNSSGGDNNQVDTLLRHCNQLVHRDIFAKDLGQFLLEAVLEAKLL